MPSRYAILGATGSTGQRLLELLASSPENDINVFVRSRPKIERLLPKIVEQKNVHIFEGDIQDVDLIRRCISSTSVVFSVVASNTNTPNLSIAQDSARILVEALEAIRRQDCPHEHIPRLLFISSYSVNSSVTAGSNRIGKWLIFKALGNIYGDLIKAEQYLRQKRQDQDWLKVVFVQPGVLSSDPIQRGYRLSTTDAGNGSFLSYTDLAAGMIEIAESGTKYDWEGVVVIPASSASFDWQAPRNLIHGLMTYFWQCLF
ncbi:hypothetical protein CBS101457_003141 [Exobasidium rhododendri]|nr:hypothetical protein CBS101457_003141 [Exobasidium rhododendri]